MSNTYKRILSALILVSILAILFYFGKLPVLAFCLLAGALSIDEILVNFNLISRSSFNYKYIQILFIVSFGILNFTIDFGTLKLLFTFFSIFLNLFLIYYLFKIPLKNEFMKGSSKKIPGILTCLIFFPLLSFGTHFDAIDWRQVLVLLFIVTFGMDTGAWFFGKNFGKRKLWPEVSPNKTVEGLFGGMFTAAILGGVFWYIFYSNLSFIIILIFALCGAISQVGDLIQSKIKREYAIKDSSSLIPGHGGVYDRIDSLIFLSPFFIIVVRYLKHLN